MTISKGAGEEHVHRSPGRRRVGCASDASDEVFAILYSAVRRKPSGQLCLSNLGPRACSKNRMGSTIRG